jgi:5-methylcytosine-specific restriction endonuclease McrA
METLVLSAAYEPVGQITWQRAVTLLFMNKVEVLEEYEDREVRSVTFAIKMPAVVRFLKALRGRRRAIKFSRENVYARDSGRCQYCGLKIPRHESTYDHVVPRSRGGKTSWENVVIACVPCNQRKGGRTPDQAAMRLLNAPVRPKKLPDTFRLTLTFAKNMPTAWQNWLRDLSYWHAELETDE